MSSRLHHSVSHHFVFEIGKMMGHRMMKREFGGLVEPSGVDVSEERRFWCETFTEIAFGSLGRLL